MTREGPEQQVLGDPQNEQTLSRIVAAVGKASAIKALGMAILAVISAPVAYFYYVSGTITAFDVRISQNADAIDTIFQVTTDKHGDLKKIVLELEAEFEDFKKPGARFSRSDWERARDAWQSKLDFLKLEIHRQLDKIQAGIPPESVTQALADLQHRVTVLEVEKKAHDWFNSDHIRGNE